MKKCKEYKRCGRMLIFALLVFVTSGCDVVKSFQKIEQESVLADETPQLVELIDDEMLAKLIIKPKKFELNVTRDPFKPLEKFLHSKEDAAELTPDEIIDGMEYLGVVKINSHYSAFLKTKNAKGVFNISDRVNQMEITDIQENYVLLKKGNKTYHIKRGGSDYEVSY